MSLMIAGASKRPYLHPMIQPRVQLAVDRHGKIGQLKEKIEPLFQSMAIVMLADTLLGSPLTGLCMVGSLFVVVPLALSLYEIAVSSEKEEHISFLDRYMKVISEITDLMNVSTSVSVGNIQIAL